MTKTPERMSASKSHLLAYLKHTPGFEQQIRTFAHLPVGEILSRLRRQNERAYQTCVSRFRQQGIELVTHA